MWQCKELVCKTGRATSDPDRHHAARRSQQTPGAAAVYTRHCHKQRTAALSAPRLGRHCMSTHSNHRPYAATGNTRQRHERGRVKKVVPWPPCEGLCASRIASCSIAEKAPHHDSVLYATGRLSTIRDSCSTPKFSQHAAWRARCTMYQCPASDRAHASNKRPGAPGRGN